MKKFLNLNKGVFAEHSAATQKELWDKVKSDHSGFTTQAEVKFVEEDGIQKMTVVMSTDSTDRHGDIVIQNWDLKNFKKNPVLLNSHRYGSIEDVLGKVNKPRVKDGKLIGETEYALDNPLGVMAQNMVEKGFISAVSVGFIPLDFNDKGHISKSELLELSLVSVPANPEALFEKSMEKAEEEKEETEEEEEVVEQPVEEEVEEKSVTHMDALAEMAHAHVERKSQLLKETLAVTQQLLAETEEKVASSERSKQMVNRAIKQLLKVKNS